MRHTIGPFLQDVSRLLTRVLTLFVEQLNLVTFSEQESGREADPGNLTGSGESHGAMIADSQGWFADSAAFRG